MPVINKITFYKFENFLGKGARKKIKEREGACILPITFENVLKILFQFQPNVLSLSLDVGDILFLQQRDIYLIIFGNPLQRSWWLYNP